MKYAFYCPNCKSFWQSDSKSEETVEPCHTCSRHPIFTGYSVEDWNKLDKSSKEAICSSIENRSVSADQPYSMVKTDKSIWIRIIRTVNWLVFILIVLASIIAAAYIIEEQPVLAVLIVVCAIVIGLLLIALGMMFVDMAVDLRAIRKQLTEKHS